VALDQPTEGLCSAKLRGRNKGKFCGTKPREGEKRCYRHGSGTAAKPGGRPIIHGRYSQRFAREAKPPQELIDQALQDPDLLDVKRPVALQSVLVQELGLIPSDEVIRQAAISYMSRAARKLAEDDDEEPEPSEAQLEYARRAFMLSSMQAVESFQRSVAAAARHAKVGELISAELLPLFEDLGRRLAVLTDKFVDKDKREDFRAAFRRDVRHVMLRAASIGEKS